MIMILNTMEKKTGQGLLEGTAGALPLPRPYERAPGEVIRATPAPVFSRARRTGAALGAIRHGV
jgi:hypothetical protein